MSECRKSHVPRPKLFWKLSGDGCPWTSPTPTPPYSIPNPFSKILNSPQLWLSHFFPVFPKPIVLDHLATLRREMKFFENFKLYKSFNLQVHSFLAVRASLRPRGVAICAFAASWQERQWSDSLSVSVRIWSVWNSSGSCRGTLRLVPVHS